MKSRCGVKIASSIGLIFGALFSLCYFGHAYATDMGMSIDIQNSESLSIILGGISSGAVSVDITPHDAAGVFNESGDVTATVISTLSGGYTLSMTRSSAAMSSSDAGNTATIDELASSEDGYTSSTFPANKWGYSLKTGEVFGNFFGIGDDGVELQDSSEATNGTTSTLKFGAKANTEMPAGSYSTTINFIATAKPASRTYVQDYTSLNCPTNPTTVVDSRDGTEYTIRKLADGKCWLLDNLALDLTDPDVQANLTSNTTNASNTTLGYLKGTTARNPSTDPDGKYATAGVEYFASSVKNDVPLIDISSKTDTGVGGYEAGRYGIYYNYCAASAGSYCYGNGGVSGTSYGNATEDICPKGWRIPTGGASGEYQTLYQYYSDDSTSLINALHTPLSGYYTYGPNPLETQGLRGLFWASTRDNNYTMYSLVIDPPDVLPQVLILRYLGLSVRCVAKEPVMQEVSRWKDYLGVNESVKAIDNRDGKSYWVTKVETYQRVPDERAECTGTGKEKVCTQIWMTQDLDLDLMAGTKTFTHSDTDLGWTDGNTNTVWTPQVATLDTIGDNDFSDSDVNTERSLNAGEGYAPDSSNSTTYASLQDCISAGYTKESCEHSSIGNYYNYYAAAALGATNNGNPISVSNTQYTTTPNSICPAGWKLPSGAKASNKYSDFSYMLYRNSVIDYQSDLDYPAYYASHIYGDENTSTDGSANVYSRPVWFAYTGYVNYGGIWEAGTSGHYWSDSIYNSDTAFSFIFSNRNEIYPDYYSGGWRLSGFAVRCIARAPEQDPDLQPTSEATLTMQNVSEWKDSLAINESVKAIDNRDGKEYWVTKLRTDSNIPDGRADCTGSGASRVCTQIWMTQNLDLDLTAGTTTFNHNNTDLGWTDGNTNTVWTPQVATATIADGFTDETDAERSYDVGNYYFYTSGSDDTDIFYASLRECVAAGHTTDDCRHYHAGNIYNFYAAGALGATSSGSPISINYNQYSEVPNSICPAGWKLPTGATAADGYSDYDYMLYGNNITVSHKVRGSYQQYGDYSLYINHSYGNNSPEPNGSTGIRKEPIWLITSGSAGNGQYYDETIMGYYWENTAFDGDNFYAMWLDSSSVGLAAFTGSEAGQSVRCVAR